MVRMMFIIIFFNVQKYIGLDDLISKHISHLFIRDPLVVFSETIDQDDSTSTDHFEVRTSLNESQHPTLLMPALLSFPNRIYSQRIGRHCASNLRRQIQPLAGALNFVAWKFR